MSQPSIGVESESQRARTRALLRGFVLLSIFLALAVVALWLELDRARAPAEADVQPPELVLEPKLVLEPAAFADLPGFTEDSLDGFAAALARSCAVRAAKSSGAPAAASPGGPGLAGTAADWAAVCESAAGAVDAAELRQVLLAELRPWSMRDRDRDQGLVTGYYEPLLHGSLRRTDRFTVPLYIRPPELVDVDLGAFREELAGKRLAGVVRGARLVPFADRTDLEQGALAGRELELLWVDDAIDAFFLHIQGSGRVELEGGRQIRVGYAAQNGHPYVAIGRELVARGALVLGEVTMQSIRAWLEAHPTEAVDIMRSNPSFVFFRQLDGDGPVGSQGVVLEPYRSIAVDTSFVALGSPIWLDGSWPSPRAGEADRTLRRLVMAQDTGGAIRGPLRADLFCGYGEEAAEIAGRLKHSAGMWLLLPRRLTPSVAGAMESR